MNEQEWLSANEAYQPLIYIRTVASIRKLRLTAAAYARWLQSFSAYSDARPCADLIEEVADHPKSLDEVELRLWGLPGSTWELSHALGQNEMVGQALSKMVFMAIAVLSEQGVGEQSIHRKMVGLLFETFGNPFQPATMNPSWLAWNDGTIRRLAQAIYDKRAFDRLPILADALQDAGCDLADLLHHCRSEGPHVRGCWVVDLLLGKK